MKGTFAKFCAIFTEFCFPESLKCSRLWGTFHKDITLYVNNPTIYFVRRVQVSVRQICV